MTSGLLQKSEGSIDQETFPAVELNWKHSQSDVIANNPNWHSRRSINGKSCFEDLKAFAVYARLSFTKFRFWRKCLLTSSLFFQFCNNLLPLAPIYRQSSHSSSLNLVSTMQVLAGMRVSSDVCFHEFINRGVSLKVNQLWAIKLSVRKLSELRSMVDERCIKDVWWEWKGRRLRTLKLWGSFIKCVKRSLLCSTRKRLYIHVYKLSAWQIKVPIIIF